MAPSKTKKPAKGRPASTAGRHAPSDRHTQILREHLVRLLCKQQAHVGFDRAVDDLPANLRGVKVPGSPHTLWQLLEHMRIAQWDIVEFCRNARHVSPPWPKGYWPPTEAPPDDTAWQRSVESFLADRHAMVELVKNPKTDLYVPIPHGEGQTILREAMLVADHNAYHLGQFILLRRLVGSWETS